MSWLTDISRVLDSYTGATPAAEAQNVVDDFHDVSQATSPDTLADALSEAFRSDQTPPFPQMLAKLFENSAGEQKAGILNQLLSSIGPAADGKQVSPETASRVLPEDVRKLAEHAERRNPGVVDEVSGFYAEHPHLVKTLGSAALTVIMARIAQKRFLGTRR
jgi:hypothetical protein